MNLVQDAAQRRLLSERAQGHYFFLDLNERASGALKVAFGGRETCEESYLVERTTYPFPTLEYVAEGSGVVSFGNGIEHTVGAGSFFAYGPRVGIKMTARSGGMMKYFVCLTGQGARAALMRPVTMLGRELKLPAHTELREVLDLLIREGRDERPGAAGLCLNLFERLRMKLEQACATLSPAMDRHREAFVRCKALVDADPIRFTSLEALTRETGLSRAYLFRLFRIHQETTPYRYLLRQKMNLAARDLLASDCLIKEVAARTGFHDPLHFSRLFKHVHGLSPAQWRKSLHRQS